MSQPLTIDFVSDVMCPWCAVGLHSLLQALEQLEGEVSTTLRFHPFELAPEMPAEGEKTVPHLMAKYGISEEQVLQNQAHITARGEELGFRFDFRADSRKWNTFDTHRLLHWAGEQGAEYQLALKQALFKAYFSHNLNPADKTLLCDLAARVGLDPEDAARVYDSGRYAKEVRAEEQLWQQRGISSVPAVVFNARYLVSGGQPVDTFVQVMREMAAQS